MLTMSLDTRAFDKALAEYMKFQRRLPSDVVNAKLYFIARNATVTTKAADPNAIESKMRSTSDKYPKVPLGALIVNKRIKAEGGTGLSGYKMARAVEKEIKRRKNAINFVRAGWKNAIVILEEYMRARGELAFARRSSPKADRKTLNKRGTEKLGTAHVARSTSGRATGEIVNDVSGQNPTANLVNIKEKGLQTAVNQEVSSMITYLERKMNPVHKEFNKQQGSG